MKILLLGPTHISFIKKFLDPLDINDAPEGYYGAPFIGTIIEELLLRGHEVVSVTTSQAINSDYLIKEFRFKSFHWIVVPERNRSFRMNGKKVGRMADFFLYERRQMIKVIQKVKPDVVHAHWSYEFASAAIDSRYPYIITVHDNHWRVLRFVPTLYRFLRGIMAELNLARANNISAVSPYLASFLKGKSKDVVVIPNPIKIKSERTFIERLVAEKTRKLSHPQLIIISNGWGSLKNGRFGLVVLKSLLKRMPNVKVHMVGGGCEKFGPAYRDAVKLGVQQNLVFHGKVSHDELLDILEGMHLLLHTSKEESFGVVLGEAASHGVPALGYYKAGAVPWVINNARLLYSNWDANEVSQIIQHLLVNYQEYESICLQAYDNVQNSFSAQNVVSAYEKYYFKVAKDSYKCTNAKKLHKS